MPRRAQVASAIGVVARAACRRYSASQLAQVAGVTARRPTCGARANWPFPHCRKRARRRRHSGLGPVHAASAIGVAARAGCRPTCDARVCPCWRAHLSCSPRANGPSARGPKRAGCRRSWCHSARTPPAPPASWPVRAWPHFRWRCGRGPLPCRSSKGWHGRLLSARQGRPLAGLAGLACRRRDGGARGALGAARRCTSAPKRGREAPWQAPGRHMGGWAGASAGAETRGEVVGGAAHGKD